MPVLPNRKYELFAQGIAKGLSQTEAYEKAGYAPNDGHASRLAGDGRVLGRVRELQEKSADNVVLTKEWIIKRLIENANGALDGEKPDRSAGNRALELLGKERGMFIERVENLNTNYAVGEKPATAKEWTDEHAEKTLDPTKPDEATIN